MQLDYYIDYIKKNIDINHKFIFHGSRNQDDIFDGKIVKTYPFIFLILLNNKQVRSYSYSDLAIHSLEIIN